MRFRCCLLWLSMVVIIADHATQEVHGGDLTTIRLKVNGIVRTLQANGVAVNDYDNLPPSIASLMRTYGVQRLNYSTSHGVWNEAWSSGKARSALPPAGGWVVAAPAAISLGPLAADLSAMLGSSLGQFSRTSPFRLTNSSMAQHFPRDLANAESVERWTALIPGQLTSEQLHLLSRRSLRACPWYAFSLSAQMQQMGKQASGDREATAYEMAVQVEFSFLLPRPSHVAKAMLPAPSAQPSMEINRTVREHKHGDHLLFTVTTWLTNACLEEQAVIITEPLPSTHTVLLHTFTYTLSSSNSSSLVADLPFFQLTPCDSNCTDSLSFSLSLPSMSSIRLQYTARRRLSNIASLPPDASYGLLLPPIAVHAGEWHYSAPMLITVPTADLSMPYTVFTLVSPPPLLLTSSYDQHTGEHTVGLHAGLAGERIRQAGHEGQGQGRRDEGKRFLAYRHLHEGQGAK